MGSFRTRARRWLLFALVVLAPACRPAEPARPTAPAFEAKPWPEADALFRSDPRWLGGDAALSVPLSPERILWLFGDSFIASAPGGGRRGARMIRNSVAIQRGADPTQAELSFHHRRDEAGLPASFFAEPGPDTWYWPGHGILLDGVLTLFLHRIVKAPGKPLGFVSSGFSAVRVDHPLATPDRWTPRPLALPRVAPEAVVGAALIERGGFVYASLVREPGDQALSLVRWRRADFVAGDLTRMQRWGGAAQGFGAGPAVPVARRVGTELSLSPAPGGPGFIMVHSGALGPSAPLARFAPALTGPWSEPVALFRPREMGREGVLIYAAKAHPGLAGAPLVVTYVTNTLDGETLLDHPSLYFPRFVRVWTE